MHVPSLTFPPYVRAHRTSPELFASRNPASQIWQLVAPRSQRERPVKASRRPRAPFRRQQSDTTPASWVLGQIWIHASNVRVGDRRSDRLRQASHFPSRYRSVRSSRTAPEAREFRRRGVQHCASSRGPDRGSRPDRGSVAGGVRAARRGPAGMAADHDVPGGRAPIHGLDSRQPSAAVPRPARVGLSPACQAAIRQPAIRTSSANCRTSGDWTMECRDVYRMNDRPDRRSRGRDRQHRRQTAPARQTARAQADRRTRRRKRTKCQDLWKPQIPGTRQAFPVDTPCCCPAHWVWGTR